MKLPPEIEQALEQRLEVARKSIAEGKGIVADDAYFERLIARAKARLPEESE